MESVESLVKTNLGEIERLLNTKTVVGEPINIEGITLIPLISAGFAFGAGGGAGKGDSRKNGDGCGGTGGGAYIRPIAVIIVTKEGVKVEPILGRFTGAMEKLGETVPQLIEKWWEQQKEKETP